MLEKRLLKRIGDGRQTNIWNERWIPNHFNGKPLVRPDFPPVTMVSELITESGGWNAELIKQVFVDVDATAILCTPIRGAGVDSWAWELEKHGLYTMCSAYRHLYNDRWCQGGDDRASASEDSTWSRVWRHIERVPNCDVCGVAEESIRHVLMECTVAKCFWHQVKELIGIKLLDLHTLTWASDLVDPRCCQEKSAATILCGMWSLWMMRNKFRHGETSPPMRKKVEWARDGYSWKLWPINP